MTDFNELEESLRKPSDDEEEWVTIAQRMYRVVWREGENNDIITLDNGERYKERPTEYGFIYMHLNE